MPMNIDELDLEPEDGFEQDKMPSPYDPENDDKPIMGMETGDDQTDIQGDTPASNDDPETDEDLVVSLLRSRGINPHAVKMVNEKDEIEEVDFESLTREQQLDILADNKIEDDYGLDPDETYLINQLRTNHLSAQEYIEAVRQQAIEDFINQQNDTSYEVDSMSDDELYLADLKAGIEDISDDEAQQALEHEKANSSLFAKKMASMRTRYKELEEQRVASVMEEENAKAQAEAQAFEDSIIETIQANNVIDLGGPELKFSEDDMEEIAAFILDADPSGVRYIAKALNDPKMLVQMSWFALKGPEAISQISDYYKGKIQEASKFNYNLGYEDAKKGNLKQANKTVVVKEPTKPNSKQVMSIDDLDYN